MLRPFRPDRKESLIFCTLALSHTTHIFNFVLTVPAQMLTSRKGCLFLEFILVIHGHVCSEESSVCQQTAYLFMFHLCFDINLVS